MKRIGLRLGVAGLALLMLSSVSAAQLTLYYTTAGIANGGNDPGRIWAFQDNHVVNVWTQAHPENGGEYAIAIPSLTIRTQGNGDNHGLGSEYTFAGTFTGTSFPYGGAGSTCFWDGATDGTHNYAVDNCNGGVWSFDTDWTNPQFLFATAVGLLGITYDTQNQSLWTSVYGGGTLIDYSLTGAVIKTFTTSANEADAALAMDYGDHTLWMKTSSLGNTFANYDRDGNLLRTVGYVGIDNDEILGGEFALFAPAPGTPEPATLVLVATGLVATFGVARRRRSQKTPR